MKKEQKMYQTGVVCRLGLSKATTSGKRSSFVSNHQSTICFLFFYLPGFRQTLHSLLIGETLKANPIYLQHSVICRETNKQIHDILLYTIFSLPSTFFHISSHFLLPSLCFGKRRLNSKTSHQMFQSP